MLKSGKYRGEKVLYPDGIGCCIWVPFGDDEDSGLCYDFSFDDIDSIIDILKQMKDVEAEVFKE